MSINIGEKKGTIIKALTTGLLLAAIFAGLLAAGPARATITFTVNNTSDAADTDTSDNRCDVNAFDLGDSCTLRAAIQQANATPGADTIRFDIAGTGVHTIDVGATGQGALPAITQTVTIDGYTQPGAHPNAQALGDDAVIEIELNGSSARSASGLDINGASNCVIRGLAINRFDGAGIVIESNIVSGTSALNNHIEGNYIGTDPSGTQDLGNGFRGIAIFNLTSNNNVVGGTSPAARNLISGNEGPFGAVDLVTGSNGTKIQGNYIGTDRTGTVDLGNGGNGVQINGENNTVGGTAPGAGNLISGNSGQGVIISGKASDGNNKVLGNRIGTTASGTAPLGNGGSGVSIVSWRNNTVGDGTAAGANKIAFNGGDGIVVGSDTTGNRISHNSIFSNAESGIDLIPGGATANDPGDSDTGANDLQNKPVLTSAKTGSGTTTIKGTLNSTTGGTFKVEFYASPSGTEGGKKVVARKTVKTDGSGNATFAFTLDKKVPVGKSVTATATDDATGDTSEFSAARKVASS